MNDLISICIPCHNRTHDLKKIMPSLIQAANASPPVEISILDYNSPDDLEDYIEWVKVTLPPQWLEMGNRLAYLKYVGRDYYHMAHARNLSVLASAGEYVVVSSTDIFFNENYFKVVREMLAEDYVWLSHNLRFVGVFVCKREEFISAGGFDERFEFYGKEDKDIALRLERRGGKRARLPARMLSLIPTSKEEKFKNYRLKLSRGEIKRRGKSIYEENIRNKILVANEGKEWGKWT